MVGEKQQQQYVSLNRLRLPGPRIDVQQRCWQLELLTSHRHVGGNLARAAAERKTQLGGDPTVGGGQGGGATSSVDGDGMREFLTPDAPVVGMN